MVHDPKLQALRRTYEVEEQRALEEKRKVDEIVTEREEAYASVKVRFEQKVERIRKLRTSERNRARGVGDGSTFAAIDAYEKRLQQELERLQAQLSEREAELKRAEARAILIQQEILAARMEMKKVDRLVENRKHAARVSDIAREEVMLEEMNYFRRKK